MVGVPFRHVNSTQDNFAKNMYLYRLFAEGYHSFSMRSTIKPTRWKEQLLAINSVKD